MSDEIVRYGELVNKKWNKRSFTEEEQEESPNSWMINLRVSTNQLSKD